MRAELCSPRKGNCMGLLFVGVLAGILIGFGWVAPSQGYFLGCASQACFDRVAVSRAAEPKPTAFEPHPAIAKASSASTIKPGERSSTKKRGRIDLAKATPPPTRISASASNRPPETSDPVLNKAKLSIAAKMEDPGSAEFSDMKRAIRKNTFGRPVDTVCGHIKGKNALGGDTGERPFLYLVKEDDAYVVDGKKDSAAAIAYRNICN
jgi:hypothetical protein